MTNLSANPMKLIYGAIERGHDEQAISLICQYGISMNVEDRLTEALGSCERVAPFVVGHIINFNVTNEQAAFWLIKIVGQGNYRDHLHRSEVAQRIAHKVYYYLKAINPWSRPNPKKPWTVSEVALMHKLADLILGHRFDLDFPSLANSMADLPNLPQGVAAKLPQRPSHLEAPKVPLDPAALEAKKIRRDQKRLEKQLADQELRAKMRGPSGGNTDQVTNPNSPKAKARARKIAQRRGKKA